MSTKGMERRAPRNRERTDGWTCDYYGQSTGRRWDWSVWRSGTGMMHLSCGWARTLRAARAAVRAVVLSHETCALRMASEGPRSRSQVAEALGVDKKRVRQIEADALAKMREIMGEDTFDMLAGGRGDETVWPDWGD
jgi:hypothetical protein